jgi:hypothetical protein
MMNACARVSMKGSGGGGCESWYKNSHCLIASSLPCYRIGKHVEEAWQPQEFRIWLAERGPGVRRGSDVRTGPESADGGSGPTRGVAVCRVALYLAANRGQGRSTL